MDDRRDKDREPDDRALFVISVAAELAGVHPQTLRIYERKGLLRPRRTPGNTRRYSQRDIERLQMIQDLTQERGINLAGVKMIMDMLLELDELKKRTEELQEELRESRRFSRKARGNVEHEPSAQIVPLRSLFVPPWESNS